jgi:hypothetical protein
MKYLSVIGGLLLALPLAGCHGNYLWSRPYAPYGKAAPDTLRGECERAAYDDPTVKETLGKAAGTTSAQEYWTQQVQNAVLAATQRCMLQRGGNGMGGGVELPRSNSN